MNALKGLIWSAAGFQLMAGSFAVVAFQPQYQAAGWVLIVGGLFFIGLGILADQQR